MTDLEHKLRAAMHAAVDGERPPENLTALVVRRSRRRSALMAWLTVAACAAVLTSVLSAALASRGTGGPIGARRAPPPTASRSRAPLPSATHRPRWLRGSPMPPGSDVRMLVSGRQPAWLAVAPRQAGPTIGLPPRQAGYQLTRVAGGWAAQPIINAPGCAPTCGAPSVAVYFVAAGSAHAARIGSAYAVAPSAGAAVWLTTFARTAAARGAVPGTARLVSITGRPMGGQVRLPGGYGIDRQVGADLLLAPLSQGPAGPPYRLWNPVTRHVDRTFPAVIAASPTLIAWVWECSSCPLNVFNVPTGRNTAIRVPARTWAYNGTFSSDSQFLAVQLSVGVTAFGNATQARTAVVSTANGLLRALPGTTLGVDTSTYLSFGWQFTSHRLVLALAKPDGSVQVGLWEPGAAHLFVITTRLPSGTSVVLDQSG